jgi:uncharacterized NAD(P)/FAD-binding protein YdhS
VTSRDGSRSRLLFAIGPLLRGTLWESIAVPELRSQALHVAETLLDELSPERTPTLRLAPEEPAVVEYWI